MTRPALLTRLGAFFAALGASASPRAASATDPSWNLTEAEWHARLSPAAFAVLRQHGTEYAGSSPLDREKRNGTYDCAGCDLPLYSSKTKFESGTGWPSFYDHLPNAIGESRDNSMFEARTEVHCSRCGGHLGHVFDDGPRPTGLRYCMNGVAMSFKPES
jgi:peptide-methionine (R)-S-oxide reductase